MGEKHPAKLSSVYLTHERKEETIMETVEKIRFCEKSWRAS